MFEKIKKKLYFGEEVEGYEIRVLNEREIRGGAGILFLFAIIMFFVGCVGGNLFAIQIFGTYFMIEFFIRVLINPKFSPSMILARLLVSNQKPEYVGAPQKRFAWSIGLSLGIIFFISVVIMGIIGPLNVILCFICMAFLYFESVFGICTGCKIYEKFLDKESKYCPGGVCKTGLKTEIQKVSIVQLIILITTLLIFISIILSFKTKNNSIDHQGIQNINIEENNCFLN